MLLLNRGRLDERVRGVVVMHLYRLDPPIPVPFSEGVLVDPLQEMSSRVPRRTPRPHGSRSRRASPPGGRDAANR